MGIIFTGVLYVQSNNGKRKASCLFTSANTRALHLEIVTHLSVEAFLLAFQRFTSLKSSPAIVVLCTASTHLSAAKELKQLLATVLTHNPVT